MEEHCSDVLISYRKNKRFLFRGVKKGGPDIFIGQPREKRKVVGSGFQEYAELCDLYLKTMGFSALRLSSIFCNSSPHEAAEWGRLYVIFPMNGFKYTWTPKHSGVPASDYDYSFLPEEIIDTLFRDEKIDIPPLPLLKKQAKEFVLKNGFKSTHFSEAIGSSHDIWFMGRYIAFRKTFYRNIAEKLKIKVNPEEIW